MSYYSEKSYNISFTKGISPAIKYLIISNVLIFVLYYVIRSEVLYLWINRWFALSSHAITSQLQVWKFFTYMFLHENIWHILFNMLILWMFGTDVEHTLGTRTFVKFYFFSGFGAGLVHIILFPNPVTGASGAIYGILVAYAILFSERIITLLLFFFIPIQMKAKYLVFVVFGSSLLLFGLFGSDSRIAHFAHLGGALFGFLYFQIPGNLNKLSNYMKERKQKQLRKEQIQHERNLQRIREEIDIILDKINEVGYDNITAEEKKVLKAYSKLLSDNEIYLDR